MTETETDETGTETERSAATYHSQHRCVVTCVRDVVHTEMSILCLLQRQSRKICTPKLPQNTYPITESGQLHIYSVISNFTHFLRSHCVHLKFPLNSFRVKGTTTTTTKNRRKKKKEKKSAQSKQLSNLFFIFPFP